MPEPLKSKDKSGAPFTRPPEIEACLGMLESVDAAARLKAFAVTSRKGSGYVPPEALTHFLRRAWAAGARDEFKQIFELLMKRVGQSMYSTVADSRMAGAQGIREEIMGRSRERRVCRQRKRAACGQPFGLMRFGGRISPCRFRCAPGPIRLRPG